MMNWIIDRFAGKRAYQPFFEKLLKLSHAGLNYGRASRYSDNGELRTLKKISDWLPNEPLTLFDVGAHVGEYSSSILKIFIGRQKQLYSFEPSKESFQELSSRFAEQAEVKLINAGLSDRSSEIQLYSNEAGSTLTSVYQRTNGAYQFQSVGKGTMFSLDEFCAANEITHIHFLKLDVEGHELQVLKGSERMLKRDAIEIIQFEFGGCDIDSRTYFRDFFILLEPKFRLYRVLKNGLEPIDQYNERLEIFQSSNFVARHR